MLHALFTCSSVLVDKKPLEICDRISLIACPDGRQLLMVMKTSKMDAGLYECLATNNMGSATTSCALSFACKLRYSHILFISLFMFMFLHTDVVYLSYVNQGVPKRPGTPEIPQIYNNTALVLWKPSDTKAPCTYTLERKSEGWKSLIMNTFLEQLWRQMSEQMN